MRYIHKAAADWHLAQRHQHPPTSAAEATAAWDNFRRHKSATAAYCLAEQYDLCGYSEIDLINQTPIFAANSEEMTQNLGIHLEHVEPKSRNPARTFDHQNLIACAIDDVKARGLVREEVFGGHAKQSWYHPDFIHPLLANCRDYFFYEASTGKVKPKMALPRRERAKARLAIYKLNLNSPVLVLWRKTWLEQADQLINELQDDREALQQFAQAELLPVCGHLRPFHSAQRQLFGNLGAQICQQNNPPL